MKDIRVFSSVTVSENKDPYADADKLIALFQGNQQTIEELEEGMNRVTSPEAMERLREWIESRPPRVQKLAREYPPYQPYEVREGAPYKITVPGTIVAPYSILEKDEGDSVYMVFTILYSPIRIGAVSVAIDPKYLRPISFEEVKERIREGGNAEV